MRPLLPRRVLLAATGYALLVLGSVFLLGAPDAGSVLGLSSIVLGVVFLVSNQPR